LRILHNIIIRYQISNIAAEMLLCLKALNSCIDLLINFYDAGRT